MIYERAIQDKSLLELFGVTSFIVPEWKIPGTESWNPANYPLWFMRDLVFLFLLSPVLSKIAKYALPILIFISVTPSFHQYFYSNGGVTLSPYSISLFLGGCFLSSLSKETKHRILEFSSPFMIVSYIIVMSISVFIGSADPSIRAIITQKSLLASFIGVAIFYQIARWIELNIPKAKEVALKFAPVTFLTFAGHAIIFSFLVPKALASNAVFVFISPLIVFAIMSTLFFAMKRWARPLLHLVAHYKLRPDDYPNMSTK